MESALLPGHRTLLLVRELLVLLLEASARRDERSLRARAAEVSSRGLSEQAALALALAGEDLLSPRREEVPSLAPSLVSASWLPGLDEELLNGLLSLLVPSEGTDAVDAPLSLDQDHADGLVLGLSALLPLLAPLEVLLPLVSAAASAAGEWDGVPAPPPSPERRSC